MSPGSFPLSSRSYFTTSSGCRLENSRCDVEILSTIEDSEKIFFEVLRKLSEKTLTKYLKSSQDAESQKSYIF